MFQSKLSEQYWAFPTCFPLDVYVLTVQSPRFSLAGLGPGPLSEKKKKERKEKKSERDAKNRRRKPAEWRSREGENAVDGATDRNCHPVGTEYFFNTSAARFPLPAAQKHPRWIGIKKNVGGINDGWRPPLVFRVHSQYSYTDCHYVWSVTIRQL